ncbi:MAG: hypothetical protein JJU09_06925 [Rhodobacteraceae bacterium]|nr:hypothetical protein [Paracoccaceae bacterium]
MRAPLLADPTLPVRFGVTILMHAGWEKKNRENLQIALQISQLICKPSKALRFRPKPYLLHMFTLPPLPESFMSVTSPPALPCPVRRA